MDINIIKNKNILVLGPTGFIGNRLIEKLLLDIGCNNVTPLIRSFSKCAKLARFNINLSKGDLLNKKELSPSFYNKHIIFNCAYDFKGTLRDNMQMINNIIDLCIENNATLVHLSTISVYEPLPDFEIDESYVQLKHNSEYAENKYKLECIVNNNIKERNLKAIILQPTIVYGPYSPTWTMNIIKQLLTGKIVLPNNGAGICSPIYIDDLCDAMILCSLSNHAIGNSYIITGPENIEWADYYNAYQNILNTNSVLYNDYKYMKKQNTSLISIIKSIFSEPKNIRKLPVIKILIKPVKFLMPSIIKFKLKSIYSAYKKISPETIYYPETSQLDLYNSKCSLSNSKAEKDFNYTPKYYYSDGMNLTTLFTKWYLSKT